MLGALNEVEAVRYISLHDVVDAIVGNDRSIAAQILNEPSLARFQEYALAGPVDEGWLGTAHLAVERGWSPQDVAGAVWREVPGWGDAQPERYGGLLRDFEALPAEDEVSVSIRDAGIALYSDSRDRALADQAREAIYDE